MLSIGICRMEKLDWSNPSLEPTPQAAQAQFER